MRKSNKNSADKFIIILTLVHGNQKAQTRQPDVQCLFKILILCIFYGDEASSQNIYFTTLNALFTWETVSTNYCAKRKEFCVFSDDSIESSFVVQLNLRQILLVCEIGAMWWIPHSHLSFRTSFKASTEFHKLQLCFYHPMLRLRTPEKTLQRINKS